MQYIITITDERIAYVGPFATPEEANEYGSNHIADPRWNVVSEEVLATADIPVHELNYLVSFGDGEEESFCTFQDAVNYANGAAPHYTNIYVENMAGDIVYAIEQGE